ncbi:MAG: hypothetical protein KGH60_04610 [Candidatus Micrarchaeota archaeon]|nr:hypothetical protein [Candidatus Micrarchaeota archaeon]
MTTTKAQNVRLMEKGEVERVLSHINKVECDDDLDGIAAGVMFYKYFVGQGKRPKVEVRTSGNKIADPKPNEVLFVISDEKVVPSDEHTLVLDKTTDGDGWVIDHHKSKIVAKNFMAFCEDGTVPTSRLTYMILPEKDDHDLFLSALGTIMDGLAEYSEKDGSIKELTAKYPELRAKSNYLNQFLRQEELYTIGDMVALLPTLNPLDAFKFALWLHLPDIHSVEDVLGLMNSYEFGGMREFALNYLNVISNPPTEKFVDYTIGGKPVKVVLESEIQPYAMPLLAEELRRAPANYVLVKDNGLSIRTQDESVYKSVVGIYGELISGSGGRVGWYGAQFKGKIGEQKALELLRSSGAADLK